MGSPGVSGAGTNSFTFLILGGQTANIVHAQLKLGVDKKLQEIGVAPGTGSWLLLTDGMGTQKKVPGKTTGGEQREGVQKEALGMLGDNLRWAEVVGSWRHNQLRLQVWPPRVPYKSGKTWPCCPRWVVARGKGGVHHCLPRAALVLVVVGGFEQTQPLFLKGGSRVRPSGEMAGVVG